MNAAAARFQQSSRAFRMARALVLAAIVDSVRENRMMVMERPYRFPKQPSHRSLVEDWALYVMALMDYLKQKRI